MAAYRTVGPTTGLKAGKATWKYTADKITVETSFTGKMSECQARKPAIGSVLPGFPGLAVAQCTAEEGDADQGTLKVTLEANVTPSGDVTTAPIGVPVYEVEWGSLTKPIETHPKCGILKPGRPYYKDGVVSSKAAGGVQLTWEDWQKLGTADYDQTGDWDLATYKAKKERGVDSYNIGAPVCRRTLYYYGDPGDVGAGVWQPQDPPYGDFDPTWHFVLSADSITKEGVKRTRKSEWTGAEEIDSDIYG